MEQTSEEPGGGRRRPWLGVVIGLGVVALLAVISVVGGHSAPGQPGAGAAAVGGVEQARAATVRRTPGDPLALGDPRAPVAVVLWADFQCPYCSQFTKEVEPRLISQYVNTGKVRFEWRDFPFLGRESNLAAVAARAAGRQGKFWAFHDALFAQQGDENSGALSSVALARIADQIGLDRARYQADIADPALATQVARDKAEATAAGVNSTPTVLIGGDLLSGALPFEEYARAIDGALAHSAASR